MKMNTGIDLELRTLLKNELRTLLDYVEAFDDMTGKEKNELREWMAHGKSVNANPFLIYGEDGCPMDFINACRFVEDMAENPLHSLLSDADDDESGLFQNSDLPF